MFSETRLLAIQHDHSLPDAYIAAWFALEERSGCKRGLALEAVRGGQAATASDVAYGRRIFLIAS
jgi:hypothetical protein